MATEPLLDSNELDDMLDAFAVQDAEVVPVDVEVPERTRSGTMLKVDLPRVARPLVIEDEIEELTDGITDGWIDDAG